MTRVCTAIPNSSSMNAHGKAKSSRIPSTDATCCSPLMLETNPQYQRNLKRAFLFAYLIATLLLACLDALVHDPGIRQVGGTHPQHRRNNFVEILRNHSAPMDH